MGGNLIIYNSDRDSLSASAGSSSEEYYLSISNILWESREQFSMSTERAGCQNQFTWTQCAVSSRILPGLNHQITYIHSQSAQYRVQS